MFVSCIYPWGKGGPVDLDRYPVLNLAVLRRIRNRTCSTRSTCSVVTDWNTGRGAKEGPLYPSPLGSGLNIKALLARPVRPRVWESYSTETGTGKHPSPPDRRETQTFRRCHFLTRSAVVFSNMKTEVAKDSRCLKQRNDDCAQLLLTGREG
ncbi:hypothetical protein CGRA01v4_06215 [Colletotrichum graminicola]|nr:hypothetical protein CGRA01v4_06215 [Colletotrichum graminicola]